MIWWFNIKAHVITRTHHLEITISISEKASMMMPVFPLQFIWLSSNDKCWTGWEQGEVETEQKTWQETEPNISGKDVHLFIISYVDIFIVHIADKVVYLLHHFVRSWLKFCKYDDFLTDDRYSQFWGKQGANILYKYLYSLVLPIIVAVYLQMVPHTDKFLNAFFKKIRCWGTFFWIFMVAIYLDLVTFFSV